MMADMLYFLDPRVCLLFTSFELLLDGGSLFRTRVQRVHDAFEIKLKKSESNWAHTLLLIMMHSHIGQHGLMGQQITLIRAVSIKYSHAAQPNRVPH